MEGNTAAKRRGSRRDGAEGCAGIEVRPLNHAIEEPWAGAKMDAKNFVARGTNFFG
jgi:hypothetical protein